MPHEEFHVVDAISVIKLMGGFADPNDLEILFPIDIKAHAIQMRVSSHPEL